MEISRLRAYEPPPERYTPKFGGNRDEDEPFVVLHRALIRDWHLRYLRMQAEIKSRAEKVSDLDEAAAAEYIEEAIKDGAEFRRDFLSAHIAGVESLMDDGEPMGLDGFLALLEELPDLARELVTHIMLGGTLSEDDEGN